MSVKNIKHNESWIVFIIAALQFINILDFMMVMPLGPDLSSDLGIPTNRLGILAASYTLAAAVAGLAGSFFLDRFNRKTALVFFSTGLGLSTLLGGWVWDMNSLIITRILAGFFGGPATSMSLSIIGDIIPSERRGRAMGKVMSSFSIASVAGVPLGLWLAEKGGWHTPFFTVGSMALVVALLVLLKFPSLTSQQQQSKIGTVNLFRPEYLLMLVTIATSMLAGFILIPNISAFLQHNLHYPRGSIDSLYAVAGALSFFSMRLAGKAVDRYGSFPVTTLSSLILLPVLYFGFASNRGYIPVMLLFVCFMIALSTRNVSVSSLGTKVPQPQERARYMSLQSFVQHMASGLAAYLSTVILTENSDQSLSGMPSIVAISMVCVILLPLLVWAVEGRLRKNERPFEVCHVSKN